MPSTLKSARLAVVLVSSLAAFAPAQRAERGVEMSGIPALNFDADEGLGYGVILQVYGYDGNAATYRWTLQPTVFLTTEGRRDYTLFFDAPSRPEHPWRITGYAGREQQLATPYYGLGNATSYDPALETGSTRYFYRYGRDRIRATADVQHALGHPSLRGLVGGGFSTDRIDLTPFDSGTTLIERDLSNHQPATGHTNYVRVGLTWDSRDREIGTHTGTWADVIVQRDERLHAIHRDGSTLPAARRSRHDREPSARPAARRRRAVLRAHRNPNHTESPGRPRRLEHRSRNSQGPLRGEGNDRLEQRAPVAGRRLLAARPRIVDRSERLPGRWPCVGRPHRLRQRAERFARGLWRRGASRVRLELRHRDGRRPLGAVNRPDLHRARIPVLNFGRD
jgi:hypothetical protein